MNTASSLLPLRVRDLSLTINGSTLLSNISFELPEGGCTALIGPNGSGKTLLLRLCHGLLAPSSGSIHWGAADLSPTNQFQAMVFQSPALLNRSVRANIEYALKLRGMPRAQRHQLGDEAMRLCGIEAIADRNTRVLSGGERQKLAIARAWVTQPQVLLMDEPTSELDPVATREIEAMIRLFAAQGVRVLLSTHDMNQVRHLADEVLFLHQGRLQTHLPVQEFFDYSGDGIMRSFATHPNREEY